MSEWKEYKLSDFIEINPKVTLKSGSKHSFVEMKDLSESQKFVLPSQLKDISGGARFQNFDTLFARITPCLQNGKICQVKGLTNSIGFGSTEFLVFRGKEGISNTDFIYYLSRYQVVRTFAEQNMIGTSGRQRVSKDAFENIELFLPPLPTQTAIAEVLSSLDDKIELNNKINQELETLAQTLFKQWFVDFEFPNENGEPYKSSGGEMVESELGEIPKGWRVGIISDIIEFNPLEKINKSIGTPYLEMANIPTSGSYPQYPVLRNFSSGSKFRNGDTLLARITPCLENGKTAYIQCLKEDEIGWGSTEFIVMRSKRNWPKELSYLIARSKDFREHAIKSMVGTSGRQRVQLDQLEKYSLVIPSNQNMISVFAKILSDLFNTINSNSLENIDLTNLRDTLLPKLISGELEVNGLNHDSLD
jgi:type I restriction enzyme S subunit